MFDNIDEIFAPDQQQLKTRSKKVPSQQKIKEMEEQQEKRQKNLSKLSQLEEDEVLNDYDNNDSDYDMDDEENSKPSNKKRSARPKKFTKEIRFGKINVNKYFFNENEDEDNMNNYDFPNYNNIVVKNISHKCSYKICDVCFNFANYTCKHCKDKYCSIECYKIHKETKCNKFLDV